MHCVPLRQWQRQRLPVVAYAVPLEHHVPTDPRLCSVEWAPDQHRWPSQCAPIVSTLTLGVIML